jgi:4-oxalocrotonate tautomerase
LVSEEIYKEIRMPTLTLKLSQSLSENALEVLAASLTKITHDLLGKRKELTALMIETLPSKQWFIGGVPISEPTAWLEISISAGTNTVQQKESFIHAAQDLMKANLNLNGVFAVASYVIVRELPTTDWGYSGITQEARKR